MDLTKSYDYFKPDAVTDRIHIIGCGSVGSTLAENLVRCGLIRFTLWDFDTVESHNLVNQMFREKDVGRNKAEALLDLLCEINPEVRAKTKVKTAGWQGEELNGYVFLAVDSIDLRRKIVEDNMNNPFIKAVFDFRTRLEDAQHYAARWDTLEQREKLLKSMQFTDEEADVDTPTSACGRILGVCTTVRIVCACGVSNFMNLANGKPLLTFVNADPFRCKMIRFEE